MSGYVRTDTTNNIADGNVISAADLDNEFNGVQAAFNSSTGHTHDGSSAEGAPITKLGPVQDVTVSTTVLGVKTTNTVDLGTSSLKFKDFYLAGNALIGGTLGVTGATTLSAALTYGGVTLSNAVTGTGNMVLSASPTLTGTITAAAANFSGAVAFNGTTTIGDADTDTITQAASYVTGTQLKSAKTATNTLSLAAYDVDGTAYTNLITLTASNTPTLTLTSTGVGTINNMSIGATTASTGAFTTLTSNGATTFTAGTASTTTGTGTLVITGGLGVSGRINAANFDGIVGANTAAAGSFTTLSATGNATLSGATAEIQFTGATYGWLRATVGDLYIDAPSTKSIFLRNAGTTIGTFSSTGLAVTGSLNATKSGGSLSTLTQTSATGYGLTIIPGADTVYDAFTINNAANTLNQIQMFGNGNAIFKGNVGIGVTSMSYPLDVKLANNQFILARESTSNITNGFRIGGVSNESKAVFSANSATGEVNLGAINTNYFLTFSTNGANERARITSAGVFQAGTIQASGTAVGSFGASRWFIQSEDSTTTRAYYTGPDASTKGVWEIYAATSTGSAVLAGRFNASANFVAQNIGLGATIPTTSGTGITFPATQSASTDANTLDDYEEGTWTPSQGAGLTVVGAFSSEGRYTKIGRLVYIWGKIAGATSIATTAGTIMFGSLPLGGAAEVSPIGVMNTDNRNVLGGFSVFGTTGYSETTLAANPAIYFNMTYTV
jgi:fibronectin-binding autotransporter adhesin